MEKVLAINEPAMTEERQAVGFPIEVFPNAIQHIIMEYENTLNFPKEFTSAGIITAVQTAIGNSLRIRVKRGHVQPITQYYILIQERGFKKSSPITAMLAPINRINKEEKAKYKQKMKDYEAKKLQAKENKEEFNEVEPTRKQLIIGRVTTEALFQLLDRNPKGILRYFNEARTWFATFNQYSNGADQEIQIDIHDGSLAQRSTRSHGTEDIYNPCSPLIGTIQPEVLIDFIKANTANGLVDRIIFDYPDHIEDKEEPRKELSETIINNWNSIVNKIYRKYDLENDIYNNIENCYVSYTPEALDIWYDWNRDNTNELKERKDLVYRGIVKKAEGNCHRLCLVLQELINVTSDKGVVKCIGVEAIKKAIILSKYYIEQQLKVRNLVEVYSMGIDAQLQAWFAILPETEFTTAEALEIGKKLGKSQRTIERWLTNHDHIERVKKGIYKKVLS